MGILENSGLVFLYLGIGYVLGKITYREYKNETPTEKLNLFGEVKRLFLFPVSYYEWDERDSFNGIDRKGNPAVSAVAMLEEKSYKISMFLWPLKLIPTLMGLAQLLFYLIWRTLCGVCLIPDFIEKKAKRLKRAKAKLLSSPIDLSFQINEIELFLEDLSKKKKSVDGRKQFLFQRICQLEENLNAWRTSLSPEESNQVADIINGLTQEIARCRQEHEKLESNEGVLIQKELELGKALGLLVRCKKTMELDVHIIGASGNKLIKEDSVASLSVATIFSADSLMVECKNLLVETS